MTADQQSVLGLNAGFDLVPVPSAAGVARRLVSELLTAWGLAKRVVEDTRLVVSELVSNAIEHAGGRSMRLELSLLKAEGIVRVSVADESAAHPTLGSVNGRAARGRGMHLVAALSRRWGTETRRGGKRIWCEMAVSA
jgi:anti-sigma regulatory factor (Ser/Thr protein kinase)